MVRKSYNKNALDVTGANHKKDKEMSQKMTTEEYRQFLSEGTRTAKVATVGADGRPHVAPVWFVLDGDTIIFTTEDVTAKGKHLLRDGRISLCVDDENPPFAFVIIEGTAEALHNATDLLHWTTEIARRYMGEALAESYGKRNAVPSEMLIRVTPTKILAHKNISG